MAMVPDRDSYICDFYHSLWCFFTLEKGLFRDNISKRASDFLFPTLHKLRNNSITSSLTRTIRDNLPGGICNEVKNYFSSKSLRKGGVSELAFHPEIGVYESAGRTGHHVGSNQ